MEFEKPITKNFRDVVKHLVPMSICKYDISAEEFKEKVIPQQWIVLRSDFEEDVTTCPCGVNIKEKCFIQNTETKKETYVGNECIKHFSAAHAGVASIANRLRKGFNVTFNKECCRHYHFTLNIHGKTTILTKNDCIINHFDVSPLNTITKEIVIHKNKDFVPPFSFKNGQIYRLTAIIKRHERKRKALYILTGIIDEVKEDMEKDYNVFSQDNKKYNVDMCCTGATDLCVILKGKTYPIKDAIKKKWPGMCQYSNGQWIITRRKDETLQSIRVWLEDDTTKNPSPYKKTKYFG